MNKDTGNWGLELLQADCAWYYPSISASLPVGIKEQKTGWQQSPYIWKSCVSERHFFDLHFDITWLLVVAEWTGKLCLQIPRHLLLRRGLSFRLAATHCTKSESSPRVKETTRKAASSGKCVQYVIITKEKIYWNTSTPEKTEATAQTS